MQDALVNALHPDKFVRASAEEYLRGLEGTSGFVWGLFEIYLKNCNENLRLVCLILARSAIARQWYVPDTANNPSPVSDSEKNQIKEFLMNKLFFNRDSNQKHLEYFILCIEAITKYSFYEQWPTLQSYLTSNLENLDEIGLKVLTTVVKTQIRRRIKYKQFKDWAQQIYPVLKRLWVHKNTLEIEKILFKCLTVLQDKEMISLLISKLKSLLACPGI
jgi:Importin-beta N-terminal domain